MTVDPFVAARTVLTAIALLALAPAPARADCPCDGKKNRKVEMTDLRFRGVLKDIVYRLDDGGLEYRFRVDRLHEGDVEDEVVIRTPSIETGCGESFSLDDSYEVDALRTDDGEFETNRCLANKLNRYPEIDGFKSVPELRNSLTAKQARAAQQLVRELGPAAKECVVGPHASGARFTVFETGDVVPDLLLMYPDDRCVTEQLSRIRVKMAGEFPFQFRVYSPSKATSETLRLGASLARARLRDALMSPLPPQTPDRLGLAAEAAARVKDWAAASRYLCILSKSATPYENAVKAMTRHDERVALTLHHKRIERLHCALHRGERSEIELAAKDAATSTTVLDVAVRLILNQGVPPTEEAPGEPVATVDEVIRMALADTQWSQHALLVEWVAWALAKRGLDDPRDSELSALAYVRLGLIQPERATSLLALAGAVVTPDTLERVQNQGRWLAQRSERVALGPALVDARKTAAHAAYAVNAGGLSHVQDTREFNELAKRQAKIDAAVVAPQEKKFDTSGALVTLIEVLGGLMFLVGIFWLGSRRM